MGSNFQNIVEEGKILVTKHLFNFQQCFLSIQNKIFFISATIILSSANSFKIVKDKKKLSFPKRTGKKDKG